MSVSIKDIARITGVAASTVSRVINEKGKISDETKKKIFAAIDELNYVPNNVARNLKNKKTKIIGVIVPDISEVFFSFIIKGIDAVLSKSGYNIFLCDSDENPQKEKGYVSLLLENRVDGIIIATVRDKFDDSSSASSPEKLFNGNIPVIFIDNIPDTKLNYDSVTIDNEKASIMAVEHLISNGHRNIAAIMGKQSETTGYERFKGYKKALIKSGINKNLVKFGDFKERSGYTAMKELLESNEPFSSVFVSSSKMTYGAILAIKEKGMKIPQDISLIGFDIHDEFNMHNPGITTILQPETEIGSVAAEFILKKLSGELKDVYQKVKLEPVLVKRESVKNLKDSMESVKDISGGQKPC
ncbi:MAG: LacI family DNA-binding transcriptional regulator [Saccharofermentanales bacterium]